MTSFKEVGNMVNDIVRFLLCDRGLDPHIDVDRSTGKSQLRWLVFASGHTSTRN